MINCETTENKLGVLPIKQLLLKTSVPLILSLLIQVLYGLVDSLYVAQISEEALSAISLCIPIQYIITGIGAGIGVGTNAMLSKGLGAADREKTGKAIGNGLFMIWIASVALALIGVYALFPFFTIQTTHNQIVNMCVRYSRILCVIAAASFHQVFFERLLSATGKTRLTMISMISGSIINAILDPIMIFGWFGFPALGIAGAAYATVIAQTIAACIGCFLNIVKNKELHLGFSDLVPQKTVILQILSVGIPVAITNGMISVLTFGVNNIILPFSVIAPAVYVACNRLQSFAIMPANGISDANVSIIAYNYGAGKNSRIIETLKVGIVSDLVISLIIMMLFMVIPKPLLLLFNASDEMLEIGVPALRIIGIGTPFLGISNILRGCLQALGRGKDSFSLSIAQAIFLIGGAWLFSRTGNLTYVWLSFPLMEVLRAIIAFGLVKHSLRVCRISKL